MLSLYVNIKVSTSAIRPVYSRYFVRVCVLARVVSWVGVKWDRDRELTSLTARPLLGCAIYNRVNDRPSPLPSPWTPATQPNCADSCRVLPNTRPVTTPRCTELRAPTSDIVTVIDPLIIFPRVRWRRGRKTKSVSIWENYYHYLTFSYQIFT